MSHLAKLTLDTGLLQGDAPPTPHSISNTGQEGPSLKMVIEFKDESNLSSWAADWLIGDRPDDTIGRPCKTERTDQRFSNFSVHMNQLEILLKCRF